MRVRVRYEVRVGEHSIQMLHSLTKRALSRDVCAPVGARGFAPCEMTNEVGVADRGLEACG